MPYGPRGKRAISESIQNGLLLDLSILMVLRKMCAEIIPLTGIEEQSLLINLLAPTVHQKTVMQFFSCG